MKKLTLLIALSLPTSYRVFSTETLPVSHMTNEVENNTSDNDPAMTQQEVAQVLARAGFPKHVVPLVTCLAEHESHFNPVAVNKNANHTHDYGLLQINSVWLKKEGCNTSVHELLNPSKNAACAYKIYKTQGLTAWTTYTTFRDTCLAYHVNDFKYEDLIADTKIKSDGFEGLM